MSEAVLHQQVADYLHLQYPRVLFRTDFAAGIKMTVGMAARHKRLQAGRAWPDLFIAHSTLYDGSVNPCAGLFLELKKEGIRLKTRNGRWVNGHIAEQASVLEQLRDQGYYAEFAVGFDEAVGYIDSYLGRVKRRQGQDEVPF